MADSNALSVLLPPDATPAAAGDYVMLEPESGDPANDWGMETDDEGNIVYVLGEEQPAITLHDEEFYENLAEVLPITVVDRIAQDLLQLIEEDKQAREPRDKQYEEGIRRTGLGKDAPGGAEFQGASKVVHPMLTQASIDFEARIIKELWPPKGPVVRPNILGENTTEKQQRADRKTAFMNYQLTTIIKEGRDVTEATLTQVPLGGAQYIKLWWDPARKRPCMQFIPIDKCYLPKSAASWQSAHRRTFSDTITNTEYLQRVKAGLYRDTRNMSPPSMAPEQSKAEIATDKVVGVDKTGTSTNVDGEREIYETMVYLEVTPETAPYLQYEDEDGLYPYLLSIDVQNRTLLGMYRDWEQEDTALEPIEHLYEFGCIPWRGGPIGLVHIIGMLSAAATGALRALLDSAFIANMQGGFILKGSGTSGQNVQPNPTEFHEIASGLETNDIRDKVLPFTTKEPSDVLFRLLGFLVDAGTGAVRTSLNEDMIDTDSNTPVGTQLSRVEEGLTVFSSIHGRIHTAFDRLLAGLHRLNRLYLPDEITLDIDGKEVFIRRDDFTGPPDVQPVSEPTIVSNQQRMSQILAVEQSAIALIAAGTPIYDMRAIQKRKLKLWNVADANELLPEPPKPIELNAINENLAMALGKPVTVFPEQDHIAHLQAHLMFGNSPVFGRNPIIAQKFTPVFLQHCAEHMLYSYVKAVHDLVSNAADMDASELFSKDPEVKRNLDRVLAMASMHVIPAADQTFASAMQVLQQSLDQLKAMMPPTPVDPGAAAVKAAADETHRKTVDDARKAALETAKVAQGSKQAAEANAAKIALAQQKSADDKYKADLAAQTKLVTVANETQTARDIEAARIASGAAQSQHLKDGASLSK